MSKLQLTLLIAIHKSNKLHMPIQAILDLIGSSGADISLWTASKPRGSISAAEGVIINQYYSSAAEFNRFQAVQMLISAPDDPNVLNFDCCTNHLSVKVLSLPFSVDSTE